MTECSFFFDHYHFTLPIDCKDFPLSSDSDACLKLPQVNTTADGEFVGYSFMHLSTNSFNILYMY